MPRRCSRTAVVAGGADCSRRPTRCKTVDIRGGNTEIGDLLTRGTTSDVYAWGSDSVVKVPRPGVPDHWIDIEASHSVRVHSIGLPTPAVLDVIDLDGRRAIVFERVRGPSMLDNLAAAPGDADSMARDLAAIQREFHSADGPSELPDKNGRIAGKIATASAATPSVYYSDDPEAVAEEMINQIPLRRLGSLDEVASVVTFLLSEESSYLTGVNLEIAGGVG
jgi:hypothetical protein